MNGPHVHAESDVIVWAMFKCRPREFVNVLYTPYVQPEFVPQDPEVEVDGHRELLVVNPQHVQNLERAISDLAVFD